MNWLARKQEPIATSETLDELVAECARHGRLVLHQFDDGCWVASLELKADNPALTVKVDSGFGDKPRRPHDAIRRMLDKLR